MFKTVVSWKPLTKRNFLFKSFHDGKNIQRIINNYGICRSMIQQRVRRSEYSTRRKNPSGRESDKTTTFPYFIGIGLLSYVILTYAVTKVDKKPLRKNMSEEEFTSLELQDGLKRKVRLLNNSNISVYLFSGRDDKIQSLDNLIVLDVDELKKQQIEENGSSYGPILKQYASENKEIPAGIISSIINQRLKLILESLKMKKIDSHIDILIMDFPQTIYEAIKFEEKVGIVDKLLVLNSDDGNKNELIGYYDIVNKVSKVKGTKDIIPLIKEEA